MKSKAMENRKRKHRRRGVPDFFGIVGSSWKLSNVALLFVQLRTPRQPTCLTKSAGQTGA